MHAAPFDSWPWFEGAEMMRVPVSPVGSRRDVMSRATSAHHHSDANLLSHLFTATRRSLELRLLGLTIDFV